MPIAALMGKRAGPDPGRRRVLTFALAVFAVLPAIITIAHRVTQDAVDSVIESGAVMEAQNVVGSLIGVMPQLGQLAEEKVLHEDQSWKLSEYVRSRGLFGVEIYDAEGHFAFAIEPTAAYTNLTRMGETVPDEIVADEASSWAAEIGPDPLASGEEESLLAEIYVPWTASDGRSFFAKVIFDITEQKALFLSGLRSLTLFLPIACATIYTLPALAYLISQVKATKQDAQVKYLSRHDALTGALNRHALTAEAEALFADRRGGPIGVIFLDLDRFKQINDEHGHEYGDMFLQHVTTILMDGVREHDLVARIGGDEFVVIVRGADADAMTKLTGRVGKAARQPFTHEGKTIRGGISIGWHLARVEDGMDASMQAADLALYHAKTSGRGTAVQYFIGLDEALKRRRLVEARLRDALAEGALEVRYQPLVAPEGGKIVGFEALSRLSDSDGTPISPAEFIPVAEETGLIHEIGEATMRQALQMAVTWPEELFVAVNLSPAEFERDLAERTRRLLAETGLDPNRLEVEVTESLLLEDEDRVAEQLVRLKALGVSIAMDDFGTGYSSLGYLWKYEFDKLKIDRLFLEAAAFGQPKHREIIETIVILGRKMGMDVTVEGVETAEQAELLSKLACDQYQGFLYGRPMSADQAAAALAAMDVGSTERPGAAGSV